MLTGREVILETSLYLTQGWPVEGVEVVEEAGSWNPRLLEESHSCLASWGPLQVTRALRG